MLQRGVHGYTNSSYWRGTSHEMVVVPLRVLMLTRCANTAYEVRRVSILLIYTIARGV